MWEAGYDVVDAPGAYVEHYEGANPEVRLSNREVMVRDRAAYRERWEGVFWNSEGPDLRDRIEVAYDDPHRTASRFPIERSDTLGALRKRAQKTSKRVRARLAGLVQA
jgi:hypothetical protein